ncbi:phage major capsid protein [Lactococcus petauri]|uniref:phage major capsid protein n=1 Tax=Lactococcus petauri TaxID=1940789 RepID=UPI0018AACE54|nr:phage major capsid protein [Lactococcus petauri]MDC0808939.1 phage major capsid protein [Lactococcus petauri]MDC0812793.1 phage major capsid protein [Lactococcus petauri]DAY98124.1 MAG TPA: major capsid protein [Caudoviricetes sp.]
MNKKLLIALQNRSKARLTELRTQVENPETRAEDLTTIQEEINQINDELKYVADQLAELEDDGSGDGSDNSGNDDTQDDENRDGGDDGDGQGQGGSDDENRSATPEQRSAALAAIGSGLSTRNAKSTKVRESEVRSAFANFVVGKISEGEARSLGIETGNGSVTVPEVIASEIITYAQEENLLRKYGTVNRTKGDVKYPVLVKKAEANVNKKERASDDEISETSIEFDEILLNPAEFDALATVTKKLLNMSGAPIETIVIDELKKAYVRKETNYMFNGDDSGNENSGALAKKAVPFVPSVAVDVTAADAGQKLYDALIEMKNTPVTEVMKKGRWIINRAALTLIEKMKTSDGFPLLRPMTQAEGGIGNSLVGYPMEFTDSADKKGAADIPVLYFGDFKSFQIQDVIGAMQMQKLVEKYAGTNRVGFQIYNLLDGQLVYSKFEPTVYRYEIGKVITSGGE